MPISIHVSTCFDFDNYHIYNDINSIINLDILMLILILDY